MSCKRPLSASTSLNFRLVAQKNQNENDEKPQKIATFWAQKLQKMNELLPLNYGPSGSFITLSA